MLELPKYKIHVLHGMIENILLAEYSDKILLLDGGSRADVRKIELFITKTLKRPISDLKLLVVTHMHPDHAGAAPILREKYAIPIAAHQKADNWYNGIGGNIQHLIDTALAHYVANKTADKKRRFWYPQKINANYLLKEADFLPFFPDWQVLETPGHTAHDISLWDPENQVLYVADIVLQMKEKCVLPFPVTLPLLMENSLLRLSQMQIKHLLLAHGGYCTKFENKQTFLQLIETLQNQQKGIFRLLQPLSRLSSCVKTNQQNPPK